MNIGFVIDPINKLVPHFDTTPAMMRSAQISGWTSYVMIPETLSVKDGIAYGTVQRLLKVDLQATPWYQLAAPEQQPLSFFQVMLMRKDPPFNIDYIYTTYILELAERQGVKVFNKPQSLRDANEKMFINWFPQCIPPTLVSCDALQIKTFLHEQRDIILKPLDGRGGTSIFRVGQHDPNVSVILETLTEHGHRYIMAQRYLPEIKKGDRRVILIDGEPVPYVMARFAASGETRANLVTGGTFQVLPISERELWLCSQIAPTLRKMGLLFVGIDVIGDYITEINVTSPAGICELDLIEGVDVGALLCAAIKRHCHAL